MGHNRYSHGLIYLSAWVTLFYSKPLNTNITLKSLVFGDEVLAQGLHLQSHQRC